MTSTANCHMGRARVRQPAASPCRRPRLARWPSRVEVQVRREGRPGARVAVHRGGREPMVGCRRRDAQESQ
eukprot:465629-Alexandrium_andersonii.AAC.1